MIRCLSIAALAVLAAACTEARVIVGPDAADAQGSLDGAIGADAGPPVEPAPGGECDQQDDCAACMQCSIAPHLSCNRLALGCEMDAECAGLATCVQGCPAEDDACLRACAEAHPEGRDPLVELYTCMLCDACPADCREHHASWCLEPPF